MVSRQKRRALDWMGEKVPLQAAGSASRGPRFRICSSLNLATVHSFPSLASLSLPGLPSISLPAQGLWRVRNDPKRRPSVQPRSLGFVALLPSLAYPGRCEATWSSIVTHVSDIRAHTVFW